MNKKRYVILGLMTLFMVLTSACFGTSSVNVGSVQNETETVTVDGAKMVQATIFMGFGELKTSGGASDLLKADLTYNVKEWKPDITYNVANEQGNLAIKQPESNIKGILNQDIQYNWDLQFNNDIPLDLSFELGAVEANLDLQGLSLNSAKFDTGAGSVDINLANTSIPSLDINGGVGSLMLDLTGDWNNDLNGTIETGVGSLTLKLPKDVGVYVNVDTGITKVNATGFKLDGDAYVNDAYGQSDVTLRLEVNAGVGSINLEMGE